MGTRLRVKHKKQARTAARKVKEKKTSPRHKIAKERAEKVLFRKNNRMA